MEFRYDVKKLEQILQDLCVLTGISIAFLDNRRNYLCKMLPKNDFCAAIQQNGAVHGKCNESDECLLDRCSRSLKMESHICHGGLYDACMPILKDQALAGYVLMGQIRLAGKADPRQWEHTPELAEWYRQRPCFTEEQIRSLWTLLPEILFQNAIRFDVFMEQVTDYISKNLHRDLSIGTICGRFGLSKNRLYSLFRETYGCSVGEYVVKLRLERAKMLLRETDEAVYAVAEQVGIPNCTYFCRLFKEKTGLSPASFRSENR